MTTNHELAVMGLSTTDSARQSALPVAVQLRSKAGRSIGMVQHFTGSMSARDIKAKLKAQGVKGKALARRVNETLRGEVDLRQQLGLAWLQAAFQSGYTADSGRLTKNSGRLQLVKVKPEVPESAESAESAPVTREAALAALGITQAEFEAIKANAAKK